VTTKNSLKELQASLTCVTSSFGVDEFGIIVSQGGELLRGKLPDSWFICGRSITGRSHVI